MKHGPLSKTRRLILLAAMNSCNVQAEPEARMKSQENRGFLYRRTVEGLNPSTPALKDGSETVKHVFGSAWNFTLGLKGTHKNHTRLI